MAGPGAVGVVEMRMTRRSWVGPLAAFGLAATIAPALARPPATQPAPGPGCNGRRPAVAHHAGGRIVAHPPVPWPVPCGTSTGFAGAESHIVATRDAVVFTPAVVPQGLLGTNSAPVSVGGDTQSNASPAALAITRDRGADWKLVKPVGVTWNPTDHSEYVDPVTGRLFFEDYGPIPLAPAFGPEQEGPAHINWSADGGRHWHHTAIPSVFLPENPRFASASAPPGQPRPHGYPDVLYFCANTNVGFVSPVIAGRVCFTSLDGGSSWQRAGTLFTGVVPQHPECAGHGESYSAIDGNYPQAATDGSLYVMVTCGGATYLARSTDEARTFPIVHVNGRPLVVPVPAAGTSPELTADLRVGTSDTFYLVTASGAHLVLRVSGDRGLHWSRALDLTAPGVTAVMHWALAERGRSEVAVAYLGQRRAQHTWDGYLTATRDAQAALRPGYGPLFWSGVVNPPQRPLLYSDNVQGAGYLAGPVPFPPPFDIQMLGNDFIGVTIAPDGTAWGSFTQDCGPTRNSPGCVRQHDQTRGYAGRLAFSGR